MIFGKSIDSRVIGENLWFECVILQNEAKVWYVIFCA